MDKLGKARTTMVAFTSLQSSGRLRSYELTWAGGGRLRGGGRGAEADPRDFFAKMAP